MGARVEVVGVVYECGECGERLGQRRCPDCGVFARRVGAGGQCPHCGELVAAQELLALESADR